MLLCSIAMHCLCTLCRASPEVPRSLAHGLCEAVTVSRERKPRRAEEIGATQWPFFILCACWDPAAELLVLPHRKYFTPPARHRFWHLFWRISDIYIGIYWHARWQQRWHTICHIFSDMFSDMSPGKFSDISSDIFIDIYFGKPSAILSTVYSDMLPAIILPNISFGIFIDIRSDTNINRCILAWWSITFWGGLFRSLISQIYTYSYLIFFWLWQHFSYYCFYFDHLRNTMYPIIFLILAT